jgi:mono/diheme cytochrome c family protein
MRYGWILLLGATVAIVACNRSPEPSESQTQQRPPPVPSIPEAPPPAQPPGEFSAQNLSRGAALYVEHCLQCHGPEGQGHPDWRTPSNGEFVAAPPVNGTGNDWKRSRSELVGIIRNGAMRNGVPVMPAYAGRLSDQDIEDILTWLQALWPPEIYERWLKANANGNTPRG